MKSENIIVFKSKKITQIFQIKIHVIFLFTYQIELLNQ